MWRSCAPPAARRFAHADKISFSRCGVASLCSEMRRIPRVDISRSAIARGLRRAHGVVSPHKVLIVDDDEDVREALRQIVIGHGMEARTAANGYYALRRVELAEVPCLILLDLWMPVMDGLATLQQLRSWPTLGRVPVVLMSAAPPKEWSKDGRLLRKPFSVDRLIEKLAVLERLCVVCSERGEGGGGTRAWAEPR